MNKINIRIWLVLIILLSIMVTPVCKVKKIDKVTQEESEKIKEWNKKGIDLLYKKDYNKAKSFFKKTLEISPNNAYANYNLACIRARRIKEQLCDICAASQGFENCSGTKIVGNPDSDIDDIFVLLKKAVASDNTYQGTMLKDPDLEEFKYDYKFNQIAGLSKIEIITKFYWKGGDQGLLHPAFFKFKADGTFNYKSPYFDNNGSREYKNSTGTYKLEGNEIKLQFINFNEPPYPIINFKELPNPLKGIFKDVKSENGDHMRTYLEIEGIDIKFDGGDDKYCGGV